MYFVGHHVYPEISYIKILVILKLGSSVIKLVKDSDNVKIKSFSSQFRIYKKLTEKKILIFIIHN